MTVNIDSENWSNRLKFLENANPNKIIVLGVNTNGPSLESIGVRKIVDAQLVKHNRFSKTIFINNT